MRYWSNKDVCVRVLDGSDQPIDNKLLMSLGQNIIYEHNPRSLSQRLASVLPKLNTEYVALMGDDEFFIPSAVKACIKELECDKSLISCFGRSMWFNNHQDVLKTSVVYESMANYSVQHDNPDDRVLYHMRHYCPSTIYSVMRTDAWKNAVSCIDNVYSIFALEELQFEIASSYLGRSKVLPVLLWMRSGENSGITDKNKFKPISNWWLDSKNQNLREDLLNKFVYKLLSGQENINQELVKNTISKAIMLYINKPKRKQSKKAILISQVAKLLSKLPISIKKTLKNRAHAIHYSLKKIQTIGDTVKKLREEDVSVDIDELKNIENIVVNFHFNLTNKK